MHSFDLHRETRASPSQWRESGEKKFALGASLQMILQSLQASVRYLRSEKQNKTRLQRDVLERLAIFSPPRPVILCQFKGWVNNVNVRVFIAGSPDFFAESCKLCDDVDGSSSITFRATFAVSRWGYIANLRSRGHGSRLWWLFPDWWALRLREMSMRGFTFKSFFGARFAMKTFAQTVRKSGGAISVWESASISKQNIVCATFYSQRRFGVSAMTKYFEWQNEYSKRHPSTLRTTSSPFLEFSYIRASSIQSVASFQKAVPKLTKPEPAWTPAFAQWRWP